jgi:uncharacterized protein
MNNQDIIAILQEHAPALKAKGVLHAALFGSVARGDHRPDSDVDILVKIDPDAKIDLFQYVGITQYLDDVFQGRADVANHDCLKTFVKPEAERDAIYAF